jgi:hypothetical protein
MRATNNTQAEFCMSDTAYSSTVPETPADTSHRITFRGVPRNMVVGITMLLAGATAFVMGMTDVFFAEALAWVFVIWGLLFLFVDLMDWLKTWTVTDDALVIRSPIRFWRITKKWDWAHVNRLDLVVRRKNPHVQDIEMQVYFTAEGDSVLDREDRVYSEELVHLIIEKAGLKATHAANPSDFGSVPPEKATYVWNRSGKFVMAS